MLLVVEVRVLLTPPSFPLIHPNNLIITQSWSEGPALLLGLTHSWHLCSLVPLKRIAEQVASAAVRRSTTRSCTRWHSTGWLTHRSCSRLAWSCTGWHTTRWLAHGPWLAARGLAHWSWLTWLTARRHACRTWLALGLPHWLTHRSGLALWLSHWSCSLRLAHWTWLASA